MNVQYVVFKLEKEEYAVEILAVQEITTYREPTSVPDAPEFIKGVMNLRGNIVPIIDLKAKLGINNTVSDESKRIVILNISESQFGIVVDDASQVIAVDKGQIDIAPQIVQTKNQNLISGIGKIDEKIIMILDFQRLLYRYEEEYFN